MAATGLTTGTWDVAFGIYVMGGLDVEVTLKYCLHHGAKNLLYCQEVIEQRYLLENVTNISAILDGQGHWETLQTFIRQWLLESSLNKWIANMNLKAGVAPSYEAVFDKYRALRAENKMAPTSYGSYASRKTWVQRFMSKWHATRGIVVTHEAEDSRAVVRKVRQGNAKKHLLGYIFRPQFECIFRPQIGCPKQSW